MTTKQCAKCKQTKAVAEFGKSTNAKDRLQAYCKACNQAQAQAAEWKKSGIDFDEKRYQRMLKAQNGNCAICGSAGGARRHAVDHDHVTSKVRALLCMDCNTGLGKFKDDPELLMAAAAYLNKHDDGQ